jgi:hypothetical protein
MGRFYIANKDLEQYLKSLGLVFHDREEPHKKYYTQHSDGKQVRIDTDKRLVTFLDEYGYVEDYSSSYTNNQIEAFLKN